MSAPQNWLQPEQHTIGTACPFCNSMFRDALAESGEAAPQLLDIAQLTARGLPRAMPM